MKVESIRIDIFDCTEEGEDIFRVHGFDDLLATSDTMDALNFVARQVKQVLKYYRVKKASDNT